MTSSSDSGQAPVPSVSVCLPVWQAAELVRIVIGGVLAQTEQDWELVVVDNASDDGLANVIAQYGEPRIRYHRYEEHVEAYRNLNRAIELARAQWVLPIGADDRLDPDALARLLEAAEAGGADRGPRPVMVAAPCRRVFPDGTPADASYYGSQRPTPVEAGVYDAAAWLAIGAAGGPFEWNIGGIVFDRGVLLAGGSFRPEVGLAADQEVILRMAAHGPVAYLDGPVVDVMVRPESEGNQRWLTERRDAAGLTPLAGALLSALAAHEQVRSVDPRERRDLIRGAARTHLVRAAQHRTLAGGQGRPGAIADLRRAARLSPGALLRPSHAALAAAALIAPSALLRWVSNRLRDRRHRDQPSAGM